MRPFLARWSAIAALVAGVIAVGTAAILSGARQPSAPPVGTITASQSRNWVGYTFTARDVTGVRAAWIEPYVAPEGSSSAESVWIGVGGLYSRAIMQAGTGAFYFEVYGGDEAWYERYPLDRYMVNGFVVYSGDVIEMMLTELPGSAHQWRIQMKDTRADEVWSRLLRYDAVLRGPDFVVEDPGLGRGRGLARFAHWGTVTFSHMQIRIGSQWRPAGEFPGLRIDMVRNGVTLAYARALRGGTKFTAIQR
jgi:Peptidase A4 family